MATLSAGSSVTVTVEAGQTLYVKGNAEVFGIGAPQIVNGDGRFGPYGVASSVTIRAISLCDYYENYTQKSFLPELIVSNDGKKVIGIKNADGSSAIGSFYSGSKNAVGFMPFMPDSQLGIGQRTFHVTTSGPEDFVSVRVIIANTGAATTLSSAAVAVNETLANPTIPTIGGTQYNAIAAGGTQNGWVACTFSGAASVAIPLGTTQAPSYTLSDIIPLQAVPRTDGGRFPLIMARTYYNGVVMPVRQANSANGAQQLDAIMGQYGYKAYVQGSVDGVGTPSAFTTNTINNNNVCAIGFIFYSISGRATVVTPGDSIIAGSSETGTDEEKGSQVVGGYIHRAIRLIAETKGYIGYVNLGIGGATPTEYLARLQAALTLGIPATLITYAPWSPNPFPPSGYPTQALWYTNGSKAIELAKTYNAKIVFVTPTPYEPWSDATREQARENIKLMGQEFIDLNQIFYDANGSGNNKWVAAYRLDGTHPNLAGHKAAALYVKPILESII